MQRSQAQPAKAVGVLVPIGLLLGWGVATTWLSTRFGPPTTLAEEPIELFVLLQIAGGLVWLWCLAALRRRSGARLLWLVVGVGLLLRLALFASTPILENDYQRYLWDGAVVAHGLDAYAHAPADLLGPESPAGPAYAPLVEEGRDVLEAVNHPDLTTVYPPIVQDAFDVAHQLEPWKPLGLRLVWLFLDFLILALLLLGIRNVQGHAWHLAIYWLNPLLLKEIYNSLHMELVLLVFLTGALLSAGSRRIMMALVMIAFAISAKLWPVYWLPLLVRMRGTGRVAAALGVGAVGVSTAFLLSPMLESAVSDGSGLAAYARGWEMNDSAFVILQALMGLVTPTHASLAARLAVGGLLLAVLARQLRTPICGLLDLAGRALVVVAAVFLLSPTQFPWYFLWCLPALVFRPNFPLLILTVTLPIYYARFRFVEHGLEDWFDYGVVWVQFIPTWVLLGRQYLGARATEPAEAR